MRIPWLPIGIVAAIVVPIALCWIATGGLPPRGERPGWVTSKPIAHRGLHTGDARRPENSLAAFEAAAEAGYPIELDVQMSADGQPVVLHDDKLDRLFRDERAVADVTAAELKQLRILGSDQRIPTLDEVLRAVRGRVPLLVEVKNEGDVGALEDAVAEKLADYDGDVAVISFNPLSLSRIARLAPSIPRGQLSGTFEGQDLAWYKRFLLRHLLMNWKSRPAFIAYELDGLPSPGVRLQRLRGRAVIGWTAEDPSGAKRAMAHADNIIFDPGAAPEKAP